MTTNHSLDSALLWPMALCLQTAQRVAALTSVDDFSIHRLAGSVHLVVQSRMQRRTLSDSAKPNLNSYLIPLDSWPRLFPWLFLLVGLVLGPLFAYSPWLFAAIGLATMLAGWCVDR